MDSFDEAKYNDPGRACADGQDDDGAGQRLERAPEWDGLTITKKSAKAKYWGHVTTACEAFN